MKPKEASLNDATAASDITTFEVRITKPHPDSKLGILLVTREEGQAPEVESLKVGGLGHSSQQLRPGDIIVSVNGSKVYDDEAASKMIRAAVKDVVLEVSRPVRRNSKAPPQPSAKPFTEGLIKMSFMDTLCGWCGMTGRPIQATPESSVVTPTGDA